MGINKEKYSELISELKSEITLVAVSKTKTAEDIKELYGLGQKNFGENYVQELVEKYTVLPKDIRWHFIGHLQSNKVKLIAPFVTLIHGVDSIKLLREINKQGEKNNLVINCLFQVHIANEETKFGMNEEELDQLINTNFNDLQDLKNIKVVGLMGMASFTNAMEKVQSEFKFLKSLFNKYSQFSNFNFQLSILSMGMSSDYKIAIEEGSNMVRIGSLIFGERNYAQ